jgi:N-acetylglucosaminyl-diphospho-decaprenol L-rhamnosyltransferase
MNETQLSVSVIIVNYNTPELTAELIASIRRHTAGVSYDIIVVDNGSEPSRRFCVDPAKPALKTIQSETNLGFGKAVNLATGSSVGTYLLFANSDCRLTSNALPVMVAYMQQNQACAACAPRLIQKDGKVHSSIRRFPDYGNIRHSRGSILRSDSNYTQVADTSRKEVEAMSATFMMVRRDLFEQLGGFDERFFMYVEDTDLCKRFHDVGKQVVYLGDVNVVHHWGASTRLHPWRMKLEHHLSIRKYFLKHYAHRRLANFLLTLQLAVNYFLVAVKMLFVPSAR